jgi:hypothetical protein
MSRILVIGDTHIPHEHKGYLAHCCKVRDENRCDTFIHIGDCYDWHSASFHDHDPDLASPASELASGRKKVALWHSQFPNMKCLKGNHDDIPARKVFAAGLPNEFLKPLSELYTTTTWTWHDELIVPGGRHKLWFKHHWAPSVINRGGDGGYSVISGHRHSEAAIKWSQFPSHSTFSLLVGCGINTKHRAFAYNKADARRPVLSCATIIQGEPHLHRMFK